MTAPRFNHVSVSAPDLEASVRFYTEVFGMTRIPSPNFGYPVAWMQSGNLQLHLFQQQVQAPAQHHFALTLGPEQLSDIYLRAKEHGWIEPETQGAAIRELADGAAQSYLRDPAGNLVEMDTPSFAALAAEVRADAKRLVEEHPQSEENLRATLFPG
ncbi:MAG TPA: VOC family protein [Candidatus Dormibacteraeota bacterium]|jgi:catechol 2,3-dioxygenase-like lactoylglutathione lyase family enzyme|nr:VOC family protein [Candidatus Dormibacteraeota bacterium]